MYRYYLFFYDNYYPCGGMYDCALKTNSFNELEQRVQKIIENYDHNCNLSYYDAMEDTTWHADIDDLEARKWRFIKWDAVTNENNWS